MMVDACGFRGDLDFILSSEAARSCKPDSVIFLRALDLAGVPATQAVFVGDTPGADIVGANRVGMRSVLTQETGFLPGLDGNDEAMQPDYVIGHLSDFVPSVLGCAYV